MRNVFKEIRKWEKGVKKDEAHLNSARYQQGFLLGEVLRQPNQTQETLDQCLDLLDAHGLHIKDIKKACKEKRAALKPVLSARLKFEKWGELVHTMHSRRRRAFVAEVLNDLKIKRLKDPKALDKANERCINAKEGYTLQFLALKKAVSVSRGELKKSMSR